MLTRNDLPKSGLVSTRILKFHFLKKYTKLLRSNMFGSVFRYYISHICAVILKMHAPKVTLSDPGRFKKFQSKSEMALSGPQEAEITAKARTEPVQPGGFLVGRWRPQTISVVWGSAAVSPGDAAHLKTAFNTGTIGDLGCNKYFPGRSRSPSSPSNTRVHTRWFKPILMPVVHHPDRPLTAPSVDAHTSGSRAAARGGGV
ncbi:hypothetical protein QMK17_23240 [Rhodococcus sp. G-MC3]|uniref:hypothetical protein n=1 Tax=Rhodococcus sp. G-MC3 TaxID=3046209 RepID=UPI0024B91476|nr:hypothetical protein [Rhodococcus sp. G-MC3]MDJ0396228.1 hypothetical protein [Rhodococcus sp. G-MC3]